MKTPQRRRRDAHLSVARLTFPRGAHAQGSVGAGVAHAFLADCATGFFFMYDLQRTTKADPRSWNP
jgi:hypothetical protein